MGESSEPVHAEQERFATIAREWLAVSRETWPISEFDESCFEGREAAEAELERVLSALAAGRGRCREDPLVGFGIAGFYLLARSCGLEIVRQKACPVGGKLLDEMWVRFRGPKAASSRPVFPIYNLVEPDPGPD